MKKKTPRGSSTQTHNRRDILQKTANRGDAPKHERVPLPPIPDLSIGRASKLREDACDAAVE
eukprot:1968476-Rhodomonas_salina.2